jgi:hypothetical protein
VTDKLVTRPRTVETTAAWSTAMTQESGELRPVKEKWEVKEWMGVGKIQDGDQCWGIIVCMAVMPSVVIKLPDGHRVSAKLEG